MSQYVYIIKCGQSRYYKIGRAADYQQRLQDLQVGNPEELKFEYVIETDDAQGLENDLHDMLYESHVRGEWYVLRKRELMILHSLFRRRRLSVVLENIEL